MEHGPLDQFYLSAEEPLQSALLALRTILLGYNEHMSQSLKWGVPTFFYKGTMACYLWKNVKKNELPYIGFMALSSPTHSWKRKVASLSRCFGTGLTMTSQ
jgi:hypothetical protein